VQNRRNITDDLDTQENGEQEDKTDVPDVKGGKKTVYFSYKKHKSLLNEI
jgi:hypothetical protein